MHVDLVESLRCPNRHVDGWLVAAADRIVARRIVEGLIGCPVCQAEWHIRDGELDFRDPAHVQSLIDATSDGGTAETNDTRAPDANRLAALLDVRDAHGVVALLGDCALGADALHDLTGVPVLAINAPPGVAHSHSRLRVHDAMPLGVGTLRGVQLDANHATVGWVTSASRALARGGRLVAPARTPVPDTVQELARDDREWVGEVREVASGLTPLRRAGDPMRLS